MKQERSTEEVRQNMHVQSQAQVSVEQVRHRTKKHLCDIIKYEKVTGQYRMMRVYLVSVSKCHFSILFLCLSRQKTGLKSNTLRSYAMLKLQIKNTAEKCHF